MININASIISQLYSINILILIIYNKLQYTYNALLYNALYS